MDTDSPRARWTGLLFSFALLSVGCAPLTPSPGRRMDLPETSACVAGDARQSALAAHLALLGAVSDVSGATRRVSSELSRLRSSKSGIAGKASGIFVRYIDQGGRQLQWIEAELASATRLANAASEVEDPDMQLALLRLAGPRLEAAMMGSILLSVWLDFLNLADALLTRRIYSIERLFMELDRLQNMLELMLKGLMETLPLLSAIRFSMPVPPPAVPSTLGLALVVGGDGVMMGTRLVVSAEWVEMMRRLVRAGVLSLPAVSAAVRIQAGQVLMAQAHDGLPPGVREALGDGPEVRGMRVTDRTGAGMSRPPRHHVLPEEFREWFEKRGFTSEMSIDRFCVELEQAHHQAIHGGGNWKLGRTWPGEWNRMIMKALRDAEVEAGRMLTRNEVLEIVAERMKEYGIAMKFIRWRGR